MRIVCRQTILMKYYALFVIFEKKKQKLKLSSAANCMWCFMGLKLMDEKIIFFYAQKFCIPGPILVFYVLQR